MKTGRSNAVFLVNAGCDRIVIGKGSQSMYQRIEKSSADRAGKFELPPVNVDDAITLLQSWCADEPQQQEEQRDTWEYLKKSLDEDRISSRKLFP